MTLEQTIEELEQNIDKVLKEIEHLQSKLDKAVDIIRTAPLKHSISLTTQKDWIKNRAKFLRDCKGE